MWSFTCHTEHMLKSGLPSTQYFHPLSSCFSHVPPTEYIYMFRICQPMVDDSKFSRMLTAGTRRWSHTSFLHYTTHTHTTTVSLHRDPHLQGLPARCASSRGGINVKNGVKASRGGWGGRETPRHSVKKRWRVAGSGGRGVLRGLYIILVFIHEFRWRNVPRVWAGKCLTGFHSLPSLPLDWRRAAASVSDLTGYITLGKLQFGNNAGQYGKNQDSGRATP